MRDGADLRVALGPEAEVADVRCHLDRAPQVGIGLVPATQLRVVHRDPRQQPGHVAPIPRTLDHLQDGSAPAVQQPCPDEHPGEPGHDQVRLRELQLGPRRAAEVDLTERRGEEGKHAHRVEARLGEAALYARNLRRDAPGPGRVGAPDAEGHLQAPPYGLAQRVEEERHCP